LTRFDVESGEGSVVAPFAALNACRGRGALGRLAVSLSALVVLAAPCSAALAAAPAPDDNRVQGLSGYWRLKDKGTAKPALTAWAKAQMRKVKTKGDVDVDAVRWCNFQGLPYVMDSAGPIRILQTPDEAVVVSERLAVPRHIYFHLAKRPDPEVFDFTPVGNTMGRRAGATLVADTLMFNDGVGPEGAPRTEKARLHEVFRVTKGGSELAITSTWTDPKVFSKPYVYTWTYEKLPASYTAVDYYCDPRVNGVGNYPPGDPRAKNNAKKK
jgi:hypothetical protein